MARKTFSAKLSDGDAACLEAVLGGASFGAWVRSRLESGGAGLQLDRVLQEVENAEARLDELVAELENGQALVEQLQAGEGMVTAKVEAANEAFARAAEQEARLGELTQAAVGMRRQLASGELLRRMASADEAGAVAILEVIEVVLQPIADWLRSTGVGEAVAIRAPQVVRSKHSFGLEWKVPPNQLLWWLAAALWRAEEAAAATGIGGGEK